MGTTERLIECVDPSFWAAYNQHPDDWCLLGAMADHCREQGREDVAEFLEWVRTKRRYATQHYSDGVYGWYYHTSQLPERLVSEDWTEIWRNDQPANCLWRLWVWRLSLPDYRRWACWQWEPTNNPTPH